VGVLRTALASLLITSAAFADVISLKDGSVIECKITNSSIIKNNQQFIEVENEKKERKEIAVDQIAAIYKGETSWEIREKNLKWYESQKDKIKDTWASQASIAKECKRRKLDEQHQLHAKKAYELRKAEAKDDMEAHSQMAYWLEKELSLFDEAQDEYRMVYEKKKEKAQDKDGEHYNLGKWCETKSLYDEAETEYNDALKLNAKNSMAKQGLDRLRQIREVLVNPVLFRTVKDQMKSAIGFYKTKGNPDGSYGSDVEEAGVQGHRAQAALCGMGLIAQWEFDGAERPEALKAVPGEIDKVLKFVLGAPEEKKALRGPDVWGNVWSIAFLTMCYKKQQFKSQKDAIKTKIDSCYGR
jgi:tetratricopeptide (TPR) repeat protein